MIRAFQDGDHAAIAEIFTRAVHEIAVADYSPEQCLAWSPRVPEPGRWETRCADKRPWVAVIDDRIAGFLELDPDGHIDCAYVNPDHQRRGVMTGLVRHAVAICIERRLPRVYVEASICARPLFEREGFTLTAARLVEIRGVKLQNYLMERPIPE